MRQMFRTGMLAAALGGCSYPWRTDRSASGSACLNDQSGVFRPIRAIGLCHRPRNGGGGLRRQAAASRSIHHRRSSEQTMSASASRGAGTTPKHRRHLRPAELGDCAERSANITSRRTRSLLAPAPHCAVDRRKVHAEHRALDYDTYGLWPRSRKAVVAQRKKCFF